MSEPGQPNPYRPESGFRPDAAAGIEPSAAGPAIESIVGESGAITIERDHIGRVTRIKTSCGSAQFRYDSQGRLYAFIYARLAWSTADGQLWTARDNKNDYQIVGQITVDENASIIITTAEVLRQLKATGVIADRYRDGSTIESRRPVPQFTAADLLSHVYAIGSPPAAQPDSSKPLTPVNKVSTASKISGTQPPVIPMPGAAPVPQTAKISKAFAKPALLPFATSKPVPAFDPDAYGLGPSSSEDTEATDPVLPTLVREAGATAAKVNSSGSQHNISSAARSPADGIMISAMAWKDPGDPTNATNAAQTSILPDDGYNDSGSIDKPRAAGTGSISKLKRVSERAADLPAQGTSGLVSRMEDSWATLQLSALEKVLGPDHPSLLPLLDRAANVNRRQCRLDLAESCASRSLEIRTRLGGPDHADLSIPLIELAGIAAEMGRLHDAEGHYAKVVEILEKGLSKARFMSWANLAPSNYQSQCLHRLLHAAASLLTIYGKQKKTVLGQKLKKRVASLAASLDASMQERFASSFQAIAAAKLPDNSASMDSAPIRRTIQAMKTNDSEALADEDESTSDPTARNQKNGALV